MVSALMFSKSSQVQAEGWRETMHGSFKLTGRLLHEFLEPCASPGRDHHRYRSGPGLVTCQTYRVSDRGGQCFSTKAGIEMCFAANLQSIVDARTTSVQSI